MRPIGFAPYSDDSTERIKTVAPSRILRSSAEEVRASGGRVYLNTQATKARFLQEIKTANVLHLATHAQADDERPEASLIAFYPTGTDSLLLNREVANLPLDQVRLVILSACEGNSGVLRKAEGILSLARSFRLAGCPTILTTTWEAHNVTTGHLVSLFYTHLHQGVPADIALQRARLDYFKSPAFNHWGHPYHWANLTLIGNPNTEFMPADSRPDWLLFVIIILTFIGVVGGILLFRSSASKPVF